METKRKTSLSGASCHGVSLCLYLALLAVFASPSPSIKFYGYDFVKIIATKIYCTNCDSTIRVSKILEKCSWIYAEDQPEKKKQNFECVKQHIHCLRLNKQCI